ncbi:hypothetical protein AXF42_Ash012101 [Apostasia shenzhenica]|uniref:FAD-binding domain-containing protein n=1 Tax=Apostasia shenzhenica TaxID=1088818 RepID=A0A2I0AJS6_9ASPA|nr:hypothetical protein AXF42_Ash012101 [Apostasia shenzhenica]
MEGLAARFLELWPRRRCSLFLSTRMIRCFSCSSSSCSGNPVGEGGEPPCNGNPVGEGGEPHIPVLIVGAGPVGLVLTFLLTKLGIKCAVLEKSPAFSQHPQAHFINNRSMELFRKMDGLADEIQKLQPPVHLWRKFIYCTSISGPILGSVDHMQPQDLEKNSPMSVAHYSQYKLIKLLLMRLERLGFRLCTPDGIQHLYCEIFKENKILMGFECTSIKPTPGGVEVGASYLKEGKLEKMNLHCSFLIGSDGARSTVRRLVSIKMQGERDLQRLVSIHFLSKDLGKYLLHKRPGMLFFIFNPAAVGALVAHDLNEGEFVLQIPCYPPQQNFEDFDYEVCEEIIFKLVGWKLQDVQVVDVKPWVMHAEVAEKYTSCNNRVILAGDSAHCFPPAGGFGMNTGIQDAHNLAWKICLLLNNVASTSIIETYEMERRPIALFNTALSVENFEAAMSVPAALGLDPAIASSMHRAINSTFGSILPSSFQRVALKAVFSLGRSQLSPFILNENNPIGSSRLARLRKIFDEGKSLQLQFPAEDLGFRYLEGALVAESDDRTVKKQASLHNFRRGSKCYVPSSKSGSRLPHMQMKSLTASSSEDVFSTLDLVPGDKVEFLLIIAPVKESYELARTALKVAEKFNVSLKICIIWPHGSSGNTISGSRTELLPWSNFIDAEEAKKPPCGSWWKMIQLSTSGAILVRPDEHIAWRTETNVIKNSLYELERVFSQVLGKI